MITKARLARPSIVLNGQDFYSSLAPYFLNLDYTDNSDGEKADDLSMQLADRDRRFINDWMPEKGAFMDVQIITERWFALNAATLVLDCGRFWIDSIDFELPAHTVTVKASSLPTDAHLKSSDETRGWENSDLKKIAGQIAEENGMELDYQAEYVPKYKRVEQTEENALRFLKTRANDVGLAIKVCRNKLIFMDEAQMEAEGPAFTIAYGNAQGTYRMTGGHFSTKITDTTKSATVAHVNPETGRLTKEEFSASGEGSSDLPDKWQKNKSADPDYEEDEKDTDSGNGGRTRALREYIPPPADLPSNWTKNDPADNEGKGAGGSKAAGRKAKAEVRDANKDKETASIDLSIGNPLIAAGQTFNLVGVGQFDGKWFIESAKHKVGPMYETSLSVRRCLHGY